MKKSDVAILWVIDKIKHGDYTLENGKLFSHTYKGLGKEVGALSHNGYLTFKGYCEGKRIRFYIHRMIWVYYNGAIPEGMTINHINGNKTDNRIENLELMTISENTAHSHRIGLSDKKGEKHHNSMLSEKQVLVIEKRLKNGEFVKELANEFGVSIYTIYSIKWHKRWKHLFE